MSEAAAHPPQRANPWLTAISFLGCAALGYLALRQKSEFVRIRLEVGSARQTAQKRIADLQLQLTAAQDAQVQAEKQAEHLKQAAAAPARPQSGGSDGMRTIHVSDIIKDHPEYAAIMARENRRNVLRQYGDAISELNLPRDQAAKLKDLLVERNLSTSDAQQAAEAAGLQRGSQAWRDAIKQATDGVDQEMTTLLGTDGRQTLQKLQLQSGMQNQIQFNYAPDLEDAGVGLTPEQSRGLAQALVSTRNPGSLPAEMRQGYNQPDPATGLSPYDNRMLEAAAQVLSPAQVQILKADQIQTNQQSAILKPYMAGAKGMIRIMMP
jgi:hypothetical protein